MISPPTLPPRAPLWLLVLITISGTLAMHMFVPALPDAARALGVDRAAMQMTITIYILGLAFGQLIYGPLSDALGRKPMLIIGLGLYALSGLAAALAFSVQMLVAARLFQALGGCAGLALGRAIVRDTAKADEAVKDLALLNLMMMIGPTLAPVVGSVLTATFGWRSIFVLLAALGGITLLYTWRRLPETARSARKTSARALMHDYGRLLRSPSFLGFALGGGASTTSFYGFIVAAPFIVSVQLHRPQHEVGLYLGMLVVGMLLGNALTRRLAGRVRTERLLIVGNAVSVVSGLMLLAIVLSGKLTVAFAIGLMFFFALGAGTVSPAALTKALSVNSRVVGSAAGLYGFTQMTIGALCTYMVGFGGDPALAAAMVVTAAAMLGQVGFWIGIGTERGRKQVNDTQRT